MYRCPKAQCDGEKFSALVVTYGEELISETGETIRTEHGRTERDGDVRCSKCGARAEWIDARQGELFAVAPTLEGMEA